jgi:ADP-dependent NAD(P)H-hydrate dehydratase / NAD(P)H-hydrate epimerase
MQAYTAEQMRALDAHGIEDLGIPGMVLMENAGRQAATLLAESLAQEGRGPVAIFCGPGNNGGDGAVIARHLSNWGSPVELFLTRPPEDLRGDARLNLDIAVRMGIPLRVLSRERPFEEQLRGTGEARAVVDAIFGTGLTRDLDPWHRGLIGVLNALDTYRFAVDLPSGVHPDTGAVLGEAFRAHRTATFGGIKLGLVQQPGRDLAGEVFLVDISLLRRRVEDTPGVPLLVGPGDPPRPPPRPAHGHKNRFGHLLVVAGSPGKGGAGLLAGQAGLRAGAGLCTLATRDDLRVEALAEAPDLMVEALGPDPLSETALEALVAGKAAVVVGPGLGTDPAARSLVLDLLETCALPRVVDADALGVYAGEGVALRPGGDRTVLTPHPGELARLLAVDKADIAADRLGMARRAAAETGCVTVLKGASTVVAAPDGRAVINLAGSVALAKAGSGDVLAGVVGALLCQGMSPWDAACLGVWSHAHAGDLGAQKTGPYGLLASDLLSGIGPALLHAAEAPDPAPETGAPRLVGATAAP